MSPLTFPATNAALHRLPNGLDVILKEDRSAPHIGSRTYESVPRQAMRATKNLINFFNGDDDVLFAMKH